MQIRTIGRIRRYLKSLRIWRKYGKLTKYHLQNDYPQISVGEETHGVPKILNYDDTATIRIGRYCSIANGVKIMRGGNHHIKWTSTYAFSDEQQWFPAFVALGESTGIRHGDVIIEDDVWIGYGAMLLPGTHIHTGAVIGGG